MTNQGEAVSKMNPEVKAKWVAALRSGEYAQGRNTLKGADGFCCLGVLCDIYRGEEGGEWRGSCGFTDATRERRLNYPPTDVLRWAGLGGDYGGEVTIGAQKTTLPDHNDGGIPFSEIADAIEAQL